MSTCSRSVHSILRLLLALGLASLAPSIVLAQDDPATDASDEADAPDEPVESYFAETTVTATGTEADTFEIPQPVIVLDPEARPADNAADLLRLEPGVDVNGVGPNQSRPVIRGQRGLRILFLQNGLRMNNARRQTDFGEIPALVGLDTVDRLEVVRGPASVLYGSDAIGGVLNLVTRVPSADQSFGGGLDLRASSADEQQKARLHLHGGRETGDDRGWSYAFGYTYRDAEDYEAPSGTFGDLTLGESATVVDTGIQDDWVDGYLGYRASDRHAVYARYDRYRADQTGFGFVPTDVLGAAEDFEIRILYPFQRFDKLTVGYEGGALDALVADTIDLQLYYQDNERELVNDILIDIGPLFPGAPPSAVESDTQNFTDLETWGLRSEQTKILTDRQLLTYGVEVWQDDSRNTDFSETSTILRFPFPPFEVVSTSTDDVPNAPNAENTSYGVFAQDEILLGDRLKVIAGARYQSVSTEAQATPGWDVDGLDFDDDAFVGAFNVLYSLTDSLNLVGTWGTAFRAPNIVERLFNGITPEGSGFQVLNADLRSEESESFDLGVKYQARRAHFEVFYFENDIENGVIQYFLSPDEIAQLPAATRAEIEASGVGFVVQQRNLDRLKYEGFELNAGYRFDRGVTVGGNFSYLEGKRVDSTNPPTGDSYSDKLNLFARWQPVGKPWMVEYRLRHQGDEDLILTAGEPTPLVGDELPGFTVHSLAGSWAFLERWGQTHTLGVLVENLTDELYAEASNVSFFRPQPERNIVLTYGLDF